jgi:opacity protein-like surface antigen
MLNLILNKYYRFVVLLTPKPTKMKIKTCTKLLLTVFALSFSIAASGLGIGPVAGVNLANISEEDNSQNSMKVGFHIGAVLELSITDNFIIAPGVLYSIKGTQSTDNSDLKINLNYLEIPINAKYRMESGFNIFAGPYIGLLMSAEVTDGTNDVDFSDFVESTDFGLNVGLGYDLESGFGFSAQYGLGLSDISKDVSGFESGTTTNAVIGISLRYMLGGNK